MDCNEDATFAIYGNGDLYDETHSCDEHIGLLVGSPDLYDNTEWLILQISAKPIGCNCEACIADGPHMSDCVVHGTDTHMGIIYARSSSCTCGRYVDNQIANMNLLPPEGE